MAIPLTALRELTLPTQKALWRVLTILLRSEGVGGVARPAGTSRRRRLAMRFALTVLALAAMSVDGLRINAPRTEASRRNVALGAAAFVLSTVICEVISAKGAGVSIGYCSRLSLPAGGPIKRM